MSSNPPSFLNSIQLRLAKARFLTFSALLHVVIIVLGGSVVLIKSEVEPPDFEAGDGKLFAPDDASAQPPPASPQAMTPEFTQAAPQASAPSLQAITATAALASSFSLSAAPTLNSDTKLAKLADSAGLGDAIDKAMAGAARVGGTGRGVFGAQEKTVSALVGTFFDLKQTRNRKPTNLSPDEFHAVFRRFVRENWRESILNDFFKGPETLYATQILIPIMSADAGPKAFGLEKEVQPSRWLVHYKARVSPPEDGTYFFVGGGDDVLIVRFNGKVVLDRCFYKQEEAAELKQKNYDYGWTNIPNGLARGEPMKLSAAQGYEMEVLIGEEPGGRVSAALMIEKEGGQYEHDKRGNPIVPPFRIAETPLPELGRGQTLPPLAANGPIWKVLPARTGRGASFDNAFAPK